MSCGRLSGDLSALCRHFAAITAQVLGLGLREVFAMPVASAASTAPGRFSVGAFSLSRLVFRKGLVRWSVPQIAAGFVAAAQSAGAFIELRFGFRPGRSRATAVLLILGLVHQGPPMPPCFSGSSGVA